MANQPKDPVKQTNVENELNGDNPTFQKPESMSNKALDTIQGMDAGGVFMTNMKWAPYSMKTKYLNLFSYAIPFFAFFHLLTAMGSFPWMFLFSTRNPLAGESTSDTPSTVAAVLWAFGYVVNCTWILLVFFYVYHDAANVGEDWNAWAYAWGYIGWAVSMWLLLTLRAVLDRNPRFGGGTFLEAKVLDMSYVTVTEGEFKGSRGRVMDRDPHNGLFHVKLEGTAHSHVKMIDHEYVEMRIFDEKELAHFQDGNHKEVVSYENAGSVMITNLLKGFGVKCADAGMTGYWSFCLMSLVPAYICFFCISFFSRDVIPKLECIRNTTCSGAYMLQSGSANDQFCCRVIDTAVSKVQLQGGSSAQLAEFVMAAGGSAVTIYSFIAVIAQVLVLGDVSVSTEKEFSYAKSVLCDEHEQRQELRIQELYKKVGLEPVKEAEKRKIT